MDLARAGLARGQRHSLLLYDTPFRSRAVDFDPYGIPWQLLPRRPGIDWAFPLRLAAILNARRTDVIHAHSETAINYAVLAKLFGGPRDLSVVGTLHVRRRLSTKATVALNLARVVGARVVAVSDALARSVRTDGLIVPLDVIPNGVDLAIAAAGTAIPKCEHRRRFGLLPDMFVVGFLGRLEEVKRPGDLVDAAATLAASHPSIHIVIGGDGSLATDLRIRTEGFKNLTLIGTVLDRACFYAALDAFVLCSEDEACPVALLEAMAFGLPVIATAVGGVPEILGGSIHGSRILVPPRSPPHIAAALAELNDLHSLGRLDGSINLSIALDHSLDKMFQRYDAVYQSN